MTGHHIERRGPALAMLLVLAAALQLAAGTGMAYVAGFSSVHALLGDFQPVWLAAVVGALGISFAGYYYAYEGMFTVDGGPTMKGSQMRTVVTVGFGGFLAHGGGVIDRYALEAAGADQREAKTRVSGLAGLEHGVLALGGTGCAVAVLASGSGQPPMDFTIPWAVIPVPGFLIAFWLAERYRDQFRGRDGWRGSLGNFLESIHLIRAMFVQPGRFAIPLAGMALFWAADAFAAWSGMAMFGFRMNVASMFVGFATGMVFTRRTGPLAGAGVLMLCLSLTIWYSGAPLAVAVVGIFVYRVLALWLPMPASLALLPTLRRMGEHHVAGAEDQAQPPDEPALRRGV
ncbi:MAG: hypothetical protein JO345_18225 [Streptosporangiaceae bacterium]|nr:hypothetical protein [Streptosporangiaceae bacterium]